MDNKKEEAVEQLIKVISALDTEYNRLAHKTQGRPDSAYYADIGWLALERYTRPEAKDDIIAALAGATSCVDAAQRIVHRMEAK